LVTAICAYGVFFPMHFIGLAGLPRRYYTNTNFPLFDDLQNVNVLITMFALVGGVFQLVFLYNFFCSIFYGKIGSESMEIKYFRMDYTSRTYSNEDFVPQCQ
jgi:heme/copper-type cytochrome/quinol oxidase subunit 1